MINVQEALQLIDTNIDRLPMEELSLGAAFGRVLATDVLSPIDMPPFNQSAMDGYAVKRADDTTREFKLVGEIKAGDDASSVRLHKGEAVRIFTGAMVPANADTVVKQESVERKDGLVRVTETFGNNENIRLTGEQVRKDAIAVPQGTLLNAGTIGYLAGLGILKVEVYKLPVVTIIATGNELIKGGQELSPGKIYESNTLMLKAALNEIGIGSTITNVRDDYSKTRDKIKNELANCDLLILSGGISVGDYDFVAEALEEIGVKEVFHKVRQKPGKPVYFGKSGQKVIFALPGNPASALTCYYVYVQKAIEKLTGRSISYSPLITFELEHPFEKHGTLTHFLKANVKDNKIRVLSAQSSAMLSSFNDANALLVLPENCTNLDAGSEVQAYLIR